MGSIMGSQKIMGSDYGSNISAAISHTTESFMATYVTQHTIPLVLRRIAFLLKKRSNEAL